MVTDILRADPHKWGPGNVHALNGDQARCGKTLAECPGQVEQGHLDNVDCLICVRSVEAEQRREEQQAKWRREQSEWDARREEKNRQWWAWYDGYLRSAEWRQRRSLVLKRAGGVCEGCGERPAQQAHHLTYQRVGNEMLFDLVAVCADCNSRLHDRGEWR